MKRCDIAHDSCRNHSSRLESGIQMGYLVPLMKYISRELDGLGKRVRERFFADYDSSWQMHPCERFTIIGILDCLKPDISIEIGTAEGGSLSAIAKFSKKVYTIDISAPPSSLQSRYDNVEFLTGKSQDILPGLLEKLKNENIQFALIDGDHSYNGVRQDIELMLSYRPKTHLYMLLHDSFDPECRRGILAANWASSPYVHYLELDFLFGGIMSIPSSYRHMAGGLALALLLSEPRSGDIDMHTSQELLFQTLLPHAANRPARTLIPRLKRYVGIMLRKSRIGQKLLGYVRNQSITS